MKSQSEPCYYRPEGPTEQGAQRFASTPATAGPWSALAQHGGPPAALLGRAIEGLTEPGRTIGRFAMNLLGPIPIKPVRVSAEVVRPGRSVALLRATMYDEEAGRAVATAEAWTFPASTDGPDQRPTALEHRPADGHPEELPASWNTTGYLESIRWQWVSGAITRPGPAVVWMRPTLPLVPGEAMTGLQRMLTCVDSASGVSAALDVREWNFLNTELTVQVLRPPVGEWICLDARTTLSSGAVGSAMASVYDERGLVGRSAQTLLVVRTGGR